MVNYEFNKGHVFKILHKKEKVPYILINTWKSTTLTTTEKVRRKLKSVGSTGIDKCLVPQSKQQISPKEEK